MKWIGSSDNITTATENEQVITSDIRSQRGELVKFDFLNITACHVRINMSDPIYLSAGQGFNNENVGSPITSLIIQEVGTEYQYIGVLS